MRRSSKLTRSSDTFLRCTIANPGMKISAILLLAVVALCTACAAAARPCESIATGYAVTHSRAFIQNGASTIYVGDVFTFPGNGLILSLPSSASGDVTPTTVIRGSRTHIVRVQGIAVDDARSSYVVVSGPAVLIFRDGAHGNRAPTHTISGSLTL